MIPAPIDPASPPDPREAAGVKVEDLLAENRALKEELQKVLEGREALIQAEKRSSLGRLASGVAHELRNPLAVILARTQLLLMATRDGSGWSLERLEKSLKTMEDQTIRASKVIEKLSAYVRPRRPEAARAELNEVITEALEMVLDRVASDAIKVQTALTQAPTIVLGDRGQLHQVFVNLVLNALQAMPDGGTVTIGTEAQPSGDSTRFPLGMVVATVSDTGEGIPPDHVRKIFDPFFSTRSQGSGLGLSITQGIVEAHKGVIRVDSGVGVGTTVVVAFPTATQAPDRTSTEMNDP